MLRKKAKTSRGMVSSAATLRIAQPLPLACPAFLLLSVILGPHFGAGQQAPEGYILADGLDTMKEEEEAPPVAPLEEHPVMDAAHREAMVNMAGAHDEAGGGDSVGGEAVHDMPEERRERIETCKHELVACIWGGSEGPGGEHGLEHGHGFHHSARAEEVEHEELEDPHRIHHATVEDIEVSAMLLGFLVLIMLLFFLVNYRDDDIRLYTWKISSSTISIFTSVFLFQGFNTIGEMFFVDQLGLDAWLYQILQCFTFMILMHLMAAHQSGVVYTSLAKQELEKEDWVFVESVRADHDQPLHPDHQVLLNNLATGVRQTKRIFKERGKKEERVVERKPLQILERRQRTRGWGMIFAHMAGFAAISAGCTLQSSEWFNWHWAMTLIPVVLVAVMIRIAVAVTECIRDSLSSRLKRYEGLPEEEDAAPGASGGAAALGKDVRVEIFEETVTESENDAQALAISFLLISSLRYAILGQQPDEEGFEEFASAEELPVAWQVSLLASIGLVFVILSGILTVSCSLRTSHHRTFKGLTAALAMTFAWAELFSARWWSFGWHLGFFSSIMGRVAVAAMLTVVVSILIFILDVIDDNLQRLLEAMHEGKDMQARRAVKLFLDIVIAAFGVLIGFSWELCFEGAVHNVASMTPYPAYVSFAMGVVVAGIVMVPWSRFILSKVIMLEGVRRAKREAEGVEEL